MSTRPLPPPRYAYDPQWARQQIDEAVASRDLDTILVVLRRIIELHGIKPIAEHLGTNRNAIYRTLRPGGDPRLSFVLDLLRCLDAELARRGAPAPAAPHTAPNAPAAANSEWSTSAVYVRMLGPGRG